MRLPAQESRDFELIVVERVMHRDRTAMLVEALRSRAWERQVDELAAGDSDVADYVRSLESREPEDSLPEASGDAIAAEFERYLRRRGNE